MTHAPDVSVVMCVYNCAGILLDSAQSVLSQEGVDLELIVVDDGSIDRTGKILEEIAQQDARVRVLREDHKGLTVGLIRGCEIARGRFIARQDAGDYSLPGRLRIQKLALEADAELSYVSCWTRVCGPKQEFLSCSKGSGRATTPTRTLSENARYGVTDGPAHHGSVMFRRDRYLAAGGYRPQFYFGQDWDLWYRLSEGGKFQMVGEVLYQACVTPHSLSGRYRREQQQISKLSYQMLLRRLREVPEDDLLELAQAIRPGTSTRVFPGSEAEGLYSIGEQLRRNGDPRSGIYLRRALEACPTMMKAWVRLWQSRLTPKR